MISSTGESDGIFSGKIISLLFHRYGDRTPITKVARIFAIGWIFLGITFNAMYLGTITSVMTKNLQVKLNFEISNQKVNIRLLLFRHIYPNKPLKFL